MLERATMPILFARPGHPGTAVTDRVLVAVDDAVDPAEAAEMMAHAGL